MFVVNPADPFGLIGQVLDGQFRVDRFVGEGGFSFVYRGHHAGLNEPIAIKCLKLPPAIGSALVESFIRRFRDESRIHYRLSQGNLAIARSIASGTTMSSTTSALVPDLVLEGLDGRSLAQDFDVRRERGEAGRSMDEVIRLLDSAAQGLAFAHAQGVVHRDMNPGNLFLAERQQSPNGTMTKVLDFGVAKVISDHALEMGPRAHTLGQIRIFAPAYGSPEQFDDAVGKVGPQSDVYSFSLIVLEALRDRSVREGEHLGEFALMALEPNGRPTPRSLGVPVGDAVEDLFKRAGALRPEDRPSDMGQFWGGLKHAIRADAESGRAPQADAVPSRPWKPRPPAAGQAPPDRPVTADMPAPAVEVHRPGSMAPVHVARGHSSPTNESAPAAPDPARSNVVSAGGGLLHGTMRIQGPPPAASSSAAALGATPAMSPLTSTLVMDPRVHNTPLPPPGLQGGQGGAPPQGRQNPLNATVAMASPYAQSQPIAPYSPPMQHAPAPPPGTVMMDASNASVAAARAMVDAAAAANERNASYAAARAMADAAATYPSATDSPFRPEVPTAVPAPPSATGKIVIIAVVAIVLLGGVAAAAVWRLSSGSASPASSATAPSASAAPHAPSAAVTAAPPASAAVAPTAAPPAEEAPSATAAAHAAPEETAGSAPEPAPAATEPSPRHTTSSSAREGAGRESPGSSAPAAATTRPASNAGTASTIPASSSAGGGCDASTARAGLDIMNSILASCRSPGGKTGDGKITVSFNPDGHVSRAVVDEPPFAGTPEATCVSSRFKQAKIAPFTGGPGTIVYTFHIPK